MAGVGTGGTLIGTGRRLQDAFPEMDIVAVEPAENAVLSRMESGTGDIAFREWDRDSSATTQTPIAGRRDDGPNSRTRKPNVVVSPTRKESSSASPPVRRTSRHDASRATLRDGADDPLVLRSSGTAASATCQQECSTEGTVELRNSLVAAVLLAASRSHLA